MTPKEFREQGYEVTFCEGFSQCDPLQHNHCKLAVGAEYCPHGKCIIVDCCTALGRTVGQCPRAKLGIFGEALVQCLESIHPTWKCERVVFV